MTEAKGAMRFASLSTNDGFTPRQRSLFAILDRAVEVARASGVQIQVWNAPVYVDEYAEGQHVYAPSIGAAVLWPRIGDYRCEAVIRKGSVFFTLVEDVMAVLSLVRKDSFGIKIEGGAR
jgi:hypothetical protein